MDETVVPVNDDGDGHRDDRGVDPCICDMGCTVSSDCGGADGCLCHIFIGQVPFACNKVNQEGGNKKWNVNWVFP